MYNYGKAVKNPDKSVYTTSATHAQTAVLKKKKQFFFRVRSYVTVNGKIYRKIKGFATVKVVKPFRVKRVSCHLFRSLQIF